jgi:hypothetical protein
MAYNRGVLPVYTDFMAEVCEKKLSHFENKICIYAVEGKYGTADKHNFQQAIWRPDSYSVRAKAIRLGKTIPERRTLQGNNRSADRHFRQRTDAERAVRHR